MCMINPEELMLGNWVRDLKTNTLVRVDGIQFSGRIVTEDKTCDDLKRGIDPEPIPLTPEILKACGGKNKGGWTGLEYMATFWDDQTEIVFQLMDGILTVFAALFPIHVSEQPTLHQLQNLYYSLTGKELEVNLHKETTT